MCTKPSRLIAHKIQASKPKPGVGRRVGITKRRRKNRIHDSRISRCHNDSALRGVQTSPIASCDQSSVSTTPTQSQLHMHTQVRPQTNNHTNKQTQHTATQPSKQPHNAHNDIGVRDSP